jgi:uncharacterized protein with HEPN domain
VPKSSTPPPDEIRARHALQAAQEAVAFLGSATAEDLEHNREKAYAVVFALATVGEALNSISDEWRTKHSAIPWREAIGLRHRLIHGYHDIRWDRVVSTVHRDLPDLIEALAAILAD